MTRDPVTRATKAYTQRIKLYFIFWFVFVCCSFWIEEKKFLWSRTHATRERISNYIGMTLKSAVQEAHFSSLHSERRHIEVLCFVFPFFSISSTFQMNELCEPNSNARHCIVRISIYRITSWRSPIFILLLILGMWLYCFFFMFANVHWMNGHILCIFIVSRMDNAIVFVKLIFGALGGDCFNCTRGIQCHMYAPSNLHWKMCSLIGIKTMAVNGLHLQFEKGYLFIWKFKLTRKRIWNVSSFVGTKMCREKMNVLLK